MKIHHNNKQSYSFWNRVPSPSPSGEGRGEAEPATKHYRNKELSLLKTQFAKKPKNPV